MGNKQKILLVFILLAAIALAFFLYQTQIKNSPTTQPGQSIKGVIQSIQLGKELRADGTRGIQINIQFKPDNQQNTLQLVANGDTIYSKYLLKTDGSTIPEQFRIAELKTGDSIEVNIDTKSVSNPKVITLIQYVQ